MQTTNVISVNTLSFPYEKERVLEDISFDVKKNDFLTIIGPNGGGKTSLLKILLGINPLQKGEIKINNNFYLNELQNIGYVPQNTNINFVSQYMISSFTLLLILFYQSVLKNL